MNTDKLNRHQEIFCQMYVSTGNGTVSYMAAYKIKNEKTAAASAARLLRNDNIIARIKELADEAADLQIMSAAQIRSFWSTTIKDTGVRMADRISASNLLAKSSGLYREKIDVTVDHEDEGGVIISLPAIPGIDPPHRDDDIWIFDPATEGKLIYGDDYEPNTAWEGPYHDMNN